MSTQTSPRGAGSSTTRAAHVVVGVESADKSNGALLWACAEAAHHHEPLELVTACPSHIGPAPDHSKGSLSSDVEASTRESMTRLAERLNSDQQVLPPRVVAGPPRNVLLDALGDDARMLVVGRRGLGAVGRALLGSTSLAVAGRARVPVVVVPDEWVPATHASAPVVVGATVGDEAEDQVLRFAFDRAREMRVPLIVVHAWEIPTIYGWSPVDIADFRSRAATALDGRLAPWRSEYPDVEVVASTAAERAVDALIDAAHVAQLVVVGRHTPASRHRGLRLGSTARGVLHRATTPVAVIPIAGSTDEKDSDSRVSADVWGPMY